MKKPDVVKIIMEAHEKGKEMQDKAIKYLEREISRNKHNLEIGRVQPADVDRVKEKIRVLEYILIRVTKG